MFRKLCALSVTGIRYYVSGYGARKYSGAPEFFRKKYLTNFCGHFCGQMKKTLVIISQESLFKKLISGTEFENGKK